MSEVNRRTKVGLRALAGLLTCWGAILLYLSFDLIKPETTYELIELLLYLTATFAAACGIWLNKRWAFYLTLAYMAYFSISFLLLTFPFSYDDSIKHFTAASLLAVPAITLRLFLTPNVMNAFFVNTKSWGKLKIVPNLLFATIAYIVSSVFFRDLIALVFTGVIFFALCKKPHRLNDSLNRASS